jgi:hypothetical protein
MRRTGRQIVLLVVVGLVFGVLLTLSDGGIVPAFAKGPIVRGPFRGQAVFATSFNGSLSELPKVTRNKTPRVLPLRGRVSASDQLVSPDIWSKAAAPSQSPSAAPNMLAPTQSFDGIGWTNVGWPPDPNGDVGPDNYIQAVNTSFAVFSKTGVLLAGPTTLDSLFSPLGASTPCGNHQNYGDPVVLYDQIADRWLVTDFAFATSALGNPLAPFYECLAVSKTGDPVAGGWYLYPMLADNALLNDYPKFGLWPDAYYMTANMYDLSTNDVHVRVWALDRNSMIAGGPLNNVYFDLPTCNGTDATCPYYSLLPSNVRGTLPPAGSPNYLANIETANTAAAVPFNSNLVHFWKYALTGSWPNPTAAFTGPFDVTVNPFLEGLWLTKSGNITMSLVPQKGTTTRLDTLGDRLMMQLQYRRIGGVESLWATHTVGVTAGSSTVAGIRWYQFNVGGGSFSVAQQGDYGPNDGLWRWMPSLAVDSQGNMAIGYSVSSSKSYPGIRYAARLSGDPAGQLSQGEGVLVKGGGSQTKAFLVGAITRWGDYSAMTIDPADDCTFWYTNEYYKSSGTHWSTRIGSKKFPTCP